MVYIGRVDGQMTSTLLEGFCKFASLEDKRRSLRASAEAKEPQCSKHLTLRCVTANPRLAHKCKCACGGWYHGFAIRFWEAFSFSPPEMAKLRAKLRAKGSRGNYSERGKG